MTDVNATATPSPMREAYLATRPTHSFNDVADRAERLTSMQALVDTRFSELGFPSAWAAYVEGLALFPRLSPANILLVLDQHSSATRLHTHRGWLTLQRTPLERGIGVLIPSVRPKHKNGRAVRENGRQVFEDVRHRPATVFDYSSTAGAQVPSPWEELSPGPPEGFIDDLRAAAASIGFAVEARRNAAPRGRRVFSLIHGLDERMKVMGLARDLGAAAGGEAGADLFAFALCRANGMDVPAPTAPPNAQSAATSARAAFRRVLQRTTFRRMV